MTIWKIVLLIISIGYVVANEGLLKPCKSSDIQCLRQATQNFMEKTSKGIADYDILPIDPLLIPDLEIRSEDNGGIVVKLKNVNITGLKNMQISDFRMDTNAKSVLLSTNANLEIDTEMSLELSNPSRVYPLRYTAKADVLSNSTYNYELRPDANGTEYYFVGPETIVGQVEGKPEAQMKFDPELLKDPVFQADNDMWASKREEMHKNVIKSITEKAYVTVVHNIRSVAKFLPKTAFFVDV